MSREKPNYANRATSGLSKFSLSDHINRKRTEIYACQPCDYKTVHKTYLNRHTWWNHMNKQTFSCACVLLINHVKIKHTAGKKMFSCDFCDFEICWLDSFKSHIGDYHRNNYNQHSKDPVAVFSCQICFYKTIATSICLKVWKLGRLHGTPQR